MTLQGEGWTSHQIEPPPPAMWPWKGGRKLYSEVPCASTLMNTPKASNENKSQWWCVCCVKSSRFQMTRGPVTDAPHPCLIPLTPSQSWDAPSRGQKQQLTERARRNCQKAQRAVFFYLSWQNSLFLEWPLARLPQVLGWIPSRLASSTLKANSLRSTCKRLSR